MTKPQLSKLFIFLVAVSALAACSKTKTSIPLSWRNPSVEHTVFKKLFVIGIGENDGGRRLFEDTFTKALAERGTSAQASWGLLPQTTQLTEEQIRGAIEGGNFDGVLISRLLSVDQSQQYVPPSTYTVPTSYHGYGYYGYYGSSYAVVHEPGYFKTNTVFRLETNLYSVANSDLVWSGQSETLNPESLTDVIDSMTAAVAKKLKEEKLIP
ncbi:MAG: hypothetical protein JRG67_09865 [Deltaproteobacteria bacterium]|nr:hypothetical protein [Deltaproteobacteria bacterium]MBW2380527.1 hypothetical protein [Deltaproteobacteria bacterium]MBW2550087.1 hypothetical protein [Deltaproteobacteria bacterium]MBW2628573.1 hypothetical protein [Deltaproteobacteria bacterium]